jgi:polar amino acid transport system substrate-binding protein
LWDPDLRLDRPDLSGVRAIRFLTTDDYPPLNFAAANGELTGFNVEIARSICEELAIGCTIQARRWDTLIDALRSGKGDAVIASIAPTGAVRAEVDFSQPYYRTPARFVARVGAAAFPTTADGLRGKKVGVVSGTAHEAFLDAFFPKVERQAFAALTDVEAALHSGLIDIAFGDGLSFSIWLNSDASSNCCEYRGGPYTESRFFGEGVGIAVRKEDVALRQALNWALYRIYARGAYSELYLKYFPIGFY